jgi:hypothetical protein
MQRAQCWDMQPHVRLAQRSLRTIGYASAAVWRLFQLACPSRTVCGFFLITGLASANVPAAAFRFEWFTIPFDSPEISVARGSFSFPDWLLGRRVYFADLDSFELRFDSPYGTSNYDLDYVRRGVFPVYFHFDFNSDTGEFVPKQINQFTTYMAAIESGFNRGFVLQLNVVNQLIIRDYTAAGYAKVSSRTKQAVPVLQFTSTNSDIMLSWPDYWDTDDFVLQQNSALQVTNWATVTNQPIVVSGRKQVMLQMSPNARFYRLVKP